MGELFMSKVLTCAAVSTLDSRAILRILYRNCKNVPTKVLMWDPCRFGQPIILAVAHMLGVAAAPQLQTLSP